MSAALSLAPSPAALEASGVSKRFGDFVALDNVSLVVRKNSVHALLGENGAGKSTLVKGIMGYHALDGGQVLVDGAAVKARNPRDAARYGIGMVYQHFTVVDNLTVTENLVLARRQHPVVFDWRAEAARVRAFMKTMPFQLDPGRPVRTMSAGEKQKLEILKQLYLETKLMILDEPTSVLTPGEADDVLGLLRRMTDSGALTVVMITHKFREVMGFADDVTVLRRGRPAGEGHVKDLTPERMAEMMMGQAPPVAQLDKQTLPGPHKLVLDIRGVKADDDIGAPALRGINLDVRAGEIVGIAGVSGNGQGQLVEVLAGQRSLTDGYVQVDGELYDAEREQMRKHGVRCLPDEPLKNACVASMSVAENMAIRGYDRPPFSWGRLFVKKRTLGKQAKSLIQSYGIRTRGADAPIGSLSGGNVQRAVLARELLDGAHLLIASNPCFGLDFAAVAEIRSRIVAARNQGTAVLLISADLDEILALADRILVMSEGQIVYETTAKAAQVAVIGQHMAGHH